MNVKQLSKRAEIINLLHRLHIYNFSFNDYDEVTVHQNVYSYCGFVTPILCIEGSMHIDANIMTMQNSPTIVTESFTCKSKFLNSLQGCPKYIGGDFTFSGNIKNLDHWPEFIGGKSFWNNGYKYIPVHIWLDQLDLPDEEKMMFKLINC